MAKAVKIIIHLKVDGTKVILKDDGLSVMQEAVGGGTVEVIRRIPSGGVLLVNEDGLIKNLSLNIQASTLAGRPIVGDVVHIIGGRSW